MGKPSFNGILSNVVFLSYIIVSCEVYILLPTRLCPLSDFLGRLTTTESVEPDCIVTTHGPPDLLSLTKRVETSQP